MATQFEIPGKVRLGEGIGGLRRLEITTEHAFAEIYLHGAHVAQFAVRRQTVGSGYEPVLFLSARSHFADGKPIRGGVPVIFPWFGPREGHPEAPMHGFARTRSWELETVTEQPDGAIAVVLRLEPSDATRALWPEPARASHSPEWVLRHRITVGAALTMELEIQNNGPAPLRCEEALHTYFCVSDVRQISVTGLEGAEYLDKADGMRRKRQPLEPIRFTQETDRTYVNTTSHCEIDDPGLNRRILIEKHGSGGTVVWNPWVAKAQAMADFGDDEWPFMVCVETGNMADNAPASAQITKTVIRTVRR